MVDTDALLDPMASITRSVLSRSMLRSIDEEEEQEQDAEHKEAEDAEKRENDEKVEDKRKAKELREKLHAIYKRDEEIKRLVAGIPKRYFHEGAEGAIFMDLLAKSEKEEDIEDEIAMEVLEPGK